MDVNFSQREIDWLNNYAGNKDLTIPAAVRHAVRVLSLVEGTPGAWDAINKLTSDRLGPKYDPMPPLPASALETFPVPVGHFWRGDVDRDKCKHCGRSYFDHLRTDESTTCPTANRRASR